MPKHGKKYLAALEGTSDVPRSAVDAVALVKSLAPANFDETVELHVSTSADPRHAEQQNAPVRCPKPVLAAVMDHVPPRPWFRTW